jgi:acyl carrier protein
MIINEIERQIIKALQEVAPEIKKDDIDGDEDIREECDLDSMDFINYLAALQRSTGIKISEGDYSNFYTFNNAKAFIKLN